MGRVKEIMMEYEECLHIIDSLIHIFSKLDCYNTEEVSSKLKYVKSLVVNKNNKRFYENRSKWHIVSNTLNDINKRINELEEHCPILTEDGTCEHDHKNCEIINDIIQTVNYALDNVIQELSENNNSRIFSSKAFYDNQIKETNLKISHVERQKKELDKKLKEQQSASIEEVSSMKNELKLLASNLIEAHNALEKYEIEKQKQEKQESIVNVWNDKIKTVFENLKEQLKPLEKEKSRLNILFISYCALSVLIVIAIGIIEWAIYCKISACSTLPNWQEYLPLITPIPVAIGLLWGFITQANRAQLQLVVLAKHIHEVKYTEGLLLAINNLSTDITDSTNRINNAIDKLLEKHLADDSHNMGWDKCEQQDKKSISSNELTNILKEIKGFVNK